MPDIAMCSGEGCSVKETCTRHMAEPNEFYQSFFMNPPGKDETCDYYWPVKQSPYRLRNASPVSKDDLPVRSES